MMYDTRSRRRAVATIAIVAGVACAGHNHAAAASEMPRIDAIRPDSVDARSGSVVELVVSGRGFSPGAPGANTVEVAGVRITGVPANAKGTELRFVVPEVASSNSEAPPQRILGGTYTLRVITAAGASNAMQITVIR
jgi:hypothetical protein